MKGTSYRYPGAGCGGLYVTVIPEAEPVQLLYLLSLSTALHHLQLTAYL